MDGSNATKRMEEMVSGAIRRKYVRIALTVAGVYLFMKYVSPVFSPFILAFLIAGFVHRTAARIPVKIKKSILTGFFLLLILTLLLLLTWGIGTFVIEKSSDLAGQVGTIRNQASMLVKNCCDRIEGRFGLNGDKMEHFVLQQINLFSENLEVQILPAVMNKSVGYMKNVVSAAAFLGITVIAAFLIMKDYEKLVRWMLANPELDGIWEVAGKVICYVKTYVRAQFILLLLISTVCAVVLGFLRIGGGILWGILTGFMDMLPFIGTGIMLVPVAIFQLLSGNYGKAAAIFALYGFCALLRELLEPKLIGNKVGIWPVGILLAVFAGVKLFGISGIIKGPLGLVIIFETCCYLNRQCQAEEETLRCSEAGEEKVQ